MSDHRDHSFADAPRARESRVTSVRVPRATVGRSSRGPQASAARPGAAVVKVHGYRHTVGETGRTLSYILSKADRATDDWERDIDRSGTDRVLTCWHLSRDDDEPPPPVPDRSCTPSDDPDLVREVKEKATRRPRIAAHMMFSLPGTDPEMEWAVAKEAARECFPDHPYVLALHTDTDSPHVHVVIRNRSYSGRALRINRNDLHHFREVLARLGQQRGLAVEARRYEVPKPPAHWRCLWPEPMGKRLDRHVAVLANPAQSTTVQLTDAMEFVRRHHKELQKHQRGRLVRATATLEKYPEWRDVCPEIVKLAFKMPEARHERRRYENSVTARTLADEAKKTSPSSDSCAPSLTPRQLRRHARALVRDIDTLDQRDRDHLAEALPILSGRDQRKVRRALKRTRTAVELERFEKSKLRSRIDGALATLATPDASRRHRRAAVRDLRAHVAELTQPDRDAVAAALPMHAGRCERKLRRALFRTRTDIEQQRMDKARLEARLNGAIATLSSPDASNKRLTAAVRDLRKHVAELTTTQRMALRMIDVVRPDQPEFADKLNREITKLYRPPRPPPPMTERIAAAVTALLSPDVEERSIPADIQATIDQAFATLDNPDAGKEDKDRATYALMHHRRHLSREQQTRTITPVDIRRDMDAALQTLAQPESSLVAKYRAALTLHVHRPHLRPQDRLALRSISVDDTGALGRKLDASLVELSRVPGPAGPVARQLDHLKPHQRDALIGKAETPEQAHDVRDLVRHGREGRAWEIARALEDAASRDFDKSCAAVKTLYPHRKQLSPHDHRELLACVERWKAPAIGSRDHTSRLATSRAILAHAPADQHARARFDLHLAVAALRKRTLSKPEVKSAVKGIRRHACFLTPEQRDDVRLSLFHHCGQDRGGRILDVIDKHRPRGTDRPVPPDKARTHAIRRSLDELAAIEESTPIRITTAAEFLSAHRAHLSDQQRALVATVMPRIERIAPHIAEALYPVAGLPQRRAPSAEDYARQAAVKEAFQTAVHPKAPAIAFDYARALLAGHEDSLTDKQAEFLRRVDVRRSLETLASAPSIGPERIAAASDTLQRNAEILSDGQRRYLPVLLRDLEAHAPDVAERLYDLAPEAKIRRDIRRSLDALANPASSGSERMATAADTLLENAAALSDGQRRFLPKLLRDLDVREPAVADRLYDLVPEAKRRRDIHRALDTLTTLSGVRSADQEAIGDQARQVKPSELVVAADVLTAHRASLTDKQCRFVGAMLHRLSGKCDSHPQFSSAIERLYELAPEAKRTRDIGRSMDTLKEWANTAPTKRGLCHVDDQSLAAAITTLQSNRDHLTDRQSQFIDSLFKLVERAHPRLMTEASARRVAIDEPHPTTPHPRPTVEKNAPQPRTTIERPAAPGPRPTVVQPVPPADAYTPSPPAFRFPDAKPNPLIDEQVTLFQSADVQRSFDAAMFLYAYRHDLQPEHHRKLVATVDTWAQPDQGTPSPENAVLIDRRTELTRRIFTHAPAHLRARDHLDLALAVKTITGNALHHEVTLSLSTLQRHANLVTDDHQRVLAQTLANPARFTPEHHHTLTEFLAHVKPVQRSRPKARTAKEHLDIAIESLQKYPNISPERKRHATTALTMLPHQLDRAQVEILRTQVPQLHRIDPSLANHVERALPQPRAQSKKQPAPPSQSQHEKQPQHRKYPKR